MDIEGLKAIWSNHDKNLDRNMKLNLSTLNELNLKKTKSKMHNLMFRRIAEALCFLVVVMALGSFIASNLSLSAPTISALILIVFGIIGLIGSIGQIILVRLINYSDPITLIQKQLAQIKAHSVQVFKLLILSIPFYMSYIFFGFKLIFGTDLYAVADTKWLIVQFIISLSLLVPTQWLYKQLCKKTTTHNWVKKLIEDLGGKQISKAVDFLEEIEKFKMEEN